MLSPMPAIIRPRRCARRAMTLVEVMFASFIVLIVVGAALMSLSVTTEASYMAAQHTAAMCLCQEKLEEIRAVPYAQVTPDALPLDANLELGHTEARDAEPIRCDRRVTIRDDWTPGVVGKRIQVQVVWFYMGRLQSETIETIIHPL